MKKTVTKEVTCCDCCEKEEHMETCINCKVEHCYACSKTEGKKYSHAVNFGGSSDGYYCKECDIELMSARNNARHIAYRKIDSLRNEAKAWSDDFKLRADEAEKEGFKILRGQKYIKQMGINDGELCVYRARIDMNDICHQLDVFPDS